MATDVRRPHAATDIKQTILSTTTSSIAGCDASHFNRPTEVAFLSNGDIIVTDGYVDNRVVRYTKDGKFIKMWSG